jgi:4-amino-4-deoxy-L-arabinose transferase-like glycosyltransferase
MSEDPATLARQIPFYTNKPLFVALVAAATSLGMNSIRATFVISAIAYGLLVLLVGLLLNATTGKRLAWLLTACLALSSPMLELGRLATPDALCAVFVLSAALSYVQRRDLSGAGLPLVLAVLVRPDVIILVFALLALQIVSFRGSRQSAIVILTLCLVAAFGPGLFQHGYSWSALFTHTFLHPVITEQDFAAAEVVSLKDYIWELVGGMTSHFKSHTSYVPVFAACSLAAWFVSRQRPDRERALHLRFQAALWLALVGHYLLFPLLGNRFFVGHYVGITLSSLVLWQRSRGFSRRAEGPAFGTAGARTAPG